MERKNGKSGSTILYLTLTHVQQGTRRKSTRAQEHKSTRAQEHTVCLKQKHVSPHLQNCFQDHRHPAQPVSQLTERAMVRKAHAVASDPTHPLHTEFDLLTSQRRYRCPKCREKNRLKNSFVPQAMSDLNKL